MRVLSHHWTDDIHPQDSGQRQRTIRNWTNYQTPAGIWAPSDPALEPITQAPADWPSGWPFPFTQGCWRSPLQVALGDNSDPANTALIGVRHSNRPECGLILKPLGVNAVPMTLDIATKTVRWTDLWTDADLEYQVANGRLSKMITMRTSSAPSAYRFAYKLFPGMSAAIVGGAVQISDAQGQQVLTLKPPWALDANNTPIRASFSPGADIAYRGVTYSTFWLTPDAQDLAAAVYPVRLDPTATISGLAAIDDAQCYKLTTNINTGASGGMGMLYWSGSDWIYRSVVRIATASLPATPHTAFRMIGRFVYDALGFGKVEAYILKDGNHEWVEGTQAFAAEVGSVCWGWQKWATLTWLSGGNAGGVIGTDCDTDASPPSLTPTVQDAWHTFTLKTAWSEAWKNGTRQNGGMVFREPATAPEQKRTSCHTSNSGTYPLYFEIDYGGGGAMPWFGARR